METLLAVENVNKYFGETQVLRDISFDVSKGEFVAIMGQSGSGKSTLLYNISGMDQPTSGEVLFQERNLTEMTDEESSHIRLKEIGFIFQHSYLLKNLTIRDNIILPAFKAGKLSREEINEVANRLLVMTGIEKVAEHDIKQVSGGQLQRAAICRALINQPKLLIGDEPTGALNSRATSEILDILNTINRGGTTIITVTHDAKVAVRASRIIYLLDGQVHAQLNLGTYDTNKANNEARQLKLDQWLFKQGF